MKASSFCYAAAGLFFINEHIAGHEWFAFSALLTGVICQAIVAEYKL